MVGKHFMCFTSTSLHAALPEQENIFWFLCNKEVQAYNTSIIIVVSDVEVATTVN